MSVLRDVVRTLHPPPGDRHGPLVPMMVALTLLTGLVDAVSYLRLGHVFVANMTGNIVFLGFALAGAGDLSIAASLLALGSFMAGALCGGWLGSRNAAHRGRLLRAATITQASLILLGLIVALLADEPLAAGVRYALIVVLALAMGVQNAAAQRLAVPELTTTVLTRTLTGLASESSAVGGAGAHAGRRGMAIAAMLAGAIAGGLLTLHVSVAATLALALALGSALALAAHLPLEVSRVLDAGLSRNVRRTLLGRPYGARPGPAPALLDRQRPFHASLAVSGHRAEELVRARLQSDRDRLGAAAEGWRGADLFS